MLKYRVLNTKTNEFLNDGEIHLNQNGEMFYNDEKLDENFELHLDLKMGDSKGNQIYMGDAFKLKLNEHFDVVQYKLENELRSLPKEYDEIIVQVEHKNPSDVYYWLSFKKDGNFITNNDCGIPDLEEEEKEAIRTVPYADMHLLWHLSTSLDSEVIYNCTSEKWLNVGSF